MKLIAVVLLAGCVDKGDGELVARLDKLENENAQLRDEVRKLKSAKPELDKEALTDWLYENPRIKMLGDWGAALQAFDHRIEGLLQPQLASLRGWFCGAGGCGRTLHECASWSLRTIAMSGPDATGAECRAARMAWCKDERSQLQCSATKCTGCTLVE